LQEVPGKETASSGMNKHRYAQHCRVSLQLKSVLILTFVVVGVTISGGWFYFSSTRTWLNHYTHQDARRMGQTLGLAAQHDLLAKRNVALQRLAGDFIRDDKIVHVVLLDSQGRVAASASREKYARRWRYLENIPVTVSSTTKVEKNRLALSRPVVMRSAKAPDGELVGAVRLVLDTSSTSRNLANVQQRICVIAAAIVLCAVPLGYILVWRILVLPVRRLVSVVRRLGEGDYTVRAGLHSNDEIGELMAAFDGMAGEIAGMRNELIAAKERLEQKVADRTEDIQVVNRRLREEIAEKEDFLRAVSHDLNAPLRNIAGIATMIMMKWRDQLPEEVVARLQRIQANVDVDTSLVMELLELSHIRSRPQKRRVVDMGELIRDLVRTFEFELKKRNIELRVRGPMPVLYVEKNRMRQVFQNLIDNAIKYMHRPRGGLIEVGYRFEENMHEFSVSDNGPGIPQSEQQRIFYVFRRACGDSAGVVEGKGVGLAVVKNVVSNYGGHAWVLSEPGGGATFYIALEAHCTEPLADADDGADDEDAQVPQCASTHQGTDSE